ncbi:MAG: cation:proton antiporter [Clostridiales bacterium]|nr:cation:proton antiporter [Clostridiales bacterium]
MNFLAFSVTNYDFDVLNLLYYLGVILIVTKGLGMLFRKIGLPQVAGMVVGGIALGLLGFLHTEHGLFSYFIKPDPVEDTVLKTLAEIGVVLILFTSGMETNVSDLKKSGIRATLIALAGVFIPIILGTLGTLLFLDGYANFTTAKLLNACFCGVILAATSVGITVETLKEMGKLNTKLGTTIVSAAIIDDVIGILALSVLSGLSGGGSALEIVWTLLRCIGFFALTLVVGFFVRKIFKSEELRHPHTRHNIIFAVGICFLFAFVAEKFFGIAAITGAYLAGLSLSGLSDTKYVDRRINTGSYIIFIPVFFAYIGLSADFSGLSLSYLWFALTFTALGIIGKIVGCGAVARATGHNTRESLAVGCGMMARGEVALAVCAMGAGLIAEGGIDPVIATVVLIVTSSILTPILLKTIFKKIGTNAPACEGESETAPAEPEQTVETENPLTTQE